MTYKETTEYLFTRIPMFERQGASGYKEGLTNTLALDGHFGHPHRNYRTIHVGGTNGKGSCAHTLAAILQQCGLKVGLYTSPHLVDFRERIRVNGQPISEDYVVDFVEHERSFFEPLYPSFFEVTTAMALRYFSDMKVDVAVIEVGLGGRLDCTNIITPTLSVVTNISFDHTQFLGDTLAKIAGEKAGIIKRGVPVVIGEATEETRPVFCRKAEEAGAPITFAEDHPEVTAATPSEDGGMVYETEHWGRIYGELGGLYQIRNANTILHAVNQLTRTDILGRYRDDAEGLSLILRKAFASVTETTGLMGRWQKIQDRPTVVCDAGHNTGGWKYISRQLEEMPCRQLHIVFGMVDDKDISSVLAMMPAKARYYFTKADSKRALSEETVKRLAASHGLTGESFPYVNAAYQAAMNNAKEEDAIFVGGSCYIIADFLKSRI
ncbi:MAG: folylpolyglutamate synthase/dihydrofolate synthase family protein [Prevotella sp.]|nr:folylpolyglutamate synthase/dihydrofolate synthase family protein [Prevotella sp.]